MLEGFDLLISLLIVVLGSVVYTTVSFGMGLVIVPVLLLFVDPIAAVVIVDVLIAFVALYVTFEARAELHIRKTYGLIIGSGIAIPIGAFALSVSEPAVLKLVIGATIIGLGIISLLNINVPLAQNKFTAVIIGFVTYLCITALGVGGPLSAWYAISQKWSVSQTRATLSAYFAIANILALVCYISLGMLEKETTINILILTPGAIIGILVAKPLVKRMKSTTFRYVSIGVIFSGGIALLSRELFNMFS
ncbi:MAG TPA: hypothetical protein DEZ08_05410 [Dehalococcoidia bacterium]|nr:hypothetical protein [Dehalococcoidia bacterium]|tara:strand:+ start:2428 stop:3174 length:747 start_codon:yes stop_codon:yes gene_type:complete